MGYDHPSEEVAADVFRCTFVPLLLCKILTGLRIHVIDEFLRVLHEHLLEIVVGVIATLPFMTSVSKLGIRPLLPFAWLSAIFFVVIWAGFAAWIPPRKR